MRRLYYAIGILVFLVMMMSIPSVGIAQDADQPDDDGTAIEETQPEGEGDVEEPDAEVEEEEIDLTDEEVAELLTRVDSFFIDQDMADLSVDVDIYRDPSRRLNDQNIRTGNPSHIAGLSTIVSHFSYRAPEFYELKIMGYVLAGSEVPEDQTFFSQLLPMPGAPIYTEDIQERFFIRFDGTDEVEGRQAYRIRYSALDRENEFFDYLVYFIDMEQPVILRVESAFDNLYYQGTGRGNYYYDEWLGKYLPIYGHGTVLFFPNRNFNVWGRWYQWNWRTPEELEAEEMEADQSETEESTTDVEEPAPEAEESAESESEDPPVSETEDPPASESDEHSDES